MAKRGPKKKLNMIRKRLNMHALSIYQLDDLVDACKLQLPLLANKLDPPLMISLLVAKEAKAVEDDLFDANDLMEAFKIEDVYEEEEVAAPVGR